MGVSSGTVVVKDWDESVDGNNKAGAVYILTKSSATAVRLISDTPRKNGRFGHGHSKVYTRNDVVIVTDPREEVDGQKNSGAVYMHSASIPRAKLVPQTARKNALFGVSIALSDSLIAVGDPRATVGDHKEAGQVYVYHTSDATVATTLTAPETQKKGRYGSSVAMSDTQLVVGAPTEQVGTQRAAGAAYLYATTLMEEPKAKLIAPTPAKNMRFGHRLELFGDSVAVAAPWETSAGIKAAGVVYVFVSRYSTVGNQTDTTTNSTNSTNGTAQTETPALSTSNSLEGTRAVMVKAELMEAELMEAQFDEVGESDDDDESDDVSDVEDDYKEDGWFDVGESDDETGDGLNGEVEVDLGESDDEGSDDSLRQVGQTESSQEVHDLGASSDLLKLGESVDAEKKKEKKQKKKKQKEVKHKAKKAKQKAKKEARQKKKEAQKEKKQKKREIQKEKKEKKREIQKEKKEKKQEIQMERKEKKQAK